jgi:protein involved in sex pheromone biosynthesis
MNEMSVKIVEQKHISDDLVAELQIDVPLDFAGFYDFIFF